MNIVAIIPARMGSSRFPGKPLARLHGMPMLGHVYFRTRLNSRLSGVYIATCDDEIRGYARSIGAACVMTSSAHTRASDRTAEAAGIIECTSGPIDAVVMVQGDEPMLVPSMVDEAVLPLLDDPAVQVVNLMAPIGPDDAADPNEVKVAVDRRSNALYFSRHSLPCSAGRPRLPCSSRSVSSRSGGAFSRRSRRWNQPRSSRPNRLTCCARWSTATPCAWRRPHTSPAASTRQPISITSRG